MLFTCESVPNSYVRFDWSIRPIRSYVRSSHVNNSVQENRILCLKKTGILRIKSYWCKN